MIFWELGMMFSMRNETIVRNQSDKTSRYILNFRNSLSSSYIVKPNTRINKCFSPTFVLYSRENRNHVGRGKEHTVVRKRLLVVSFLSENVIPNSPKITEGGTF